MGGLTPMFAISAGLSALNTVAGISQARQQEKVAAQEAAIRSRQAQTEIDALQQQKLDADEERRDRLERTTAAQRAAFAASGVSADGSAGAVFDSLLSDSRREADSFNAEIDRRISGLQSGIQLNLLSRKNSGTLGALAGLGEDTLRAWNRYAKS